MWLTPSAESYLALANEARLSGHQLDFMRASPKVAWGKHFLTTVSNPQGSEKSCARFSRLFFQEMKDRFHIEFTMPSQETTCQTVYEFIGTYALTPNNWKSFIKAWANVADTKEERETRNRFLRMINYKEYELKIKEEQHARPRSPSSSIASNGSTVYFTAPQSREMSPYSTTAQCSSDEELDYHRLIYEGLYKPLAIKDYPCFRDLPIKLQSILQVKNIVEE